MNKIQFIFVILLFTTIYSSTKNENEIQFMSGLYLINSRSDMTDSLKALKFYELQKVTGITTMDAILFVEKYRNKPKELNSLYNSINSLFSTPYQDSSVSIVKDSSVSMDDDSSDSIFPNDSILSDSTSVVPPIESADVEKK